MIVGFLLLLTPQLFAGGWTSGGGELIRDAHNPWFMANTKVVKYCIQINEKDFGQPESFVRAQILKAIEFWQIQLKDLAYWRSNSGFSYQLGTQNFAEVNCQQTPDITFQFATLTDDQKIKLGDISKTVAVSVRTDYDLVNLKGKGFVFVQADAHFSTAPWSRSNGSRVLPVLIHEMGHVFGIQHSRDIEFMNEDYAEYLVKDTNVDSIDGETEFLAQSYKAKRLFAYQVGGLQLLGVCRIGAPIKRPKPIIRKTDAVRTFDKYFEIPQADNCRAISVSGNEFIIKTGVNKSTLLGKAILVQKDSTDLMDMYDGIPAAHFWCPPEQKVFSASDFEISNKAIIGNFQSRQFFKGTYKSIDGKVSRPIGLELTNGGSIQKITGFMDGELMIDLQSGF